VSGVTAVFADHLVQPWGGPKVGHLLGQSAELCAADHFAPLLDGVQLCYVHEPEAGTGASGRDAASSGTKMISSDMAAIIRATGAPAARRPCCPPQTRSDR
jgi:hypothetical protein